MNKKLAVPINPASFVECRKSRGWSQEELSRRSGYSVRLIRKAEAGGTLKVETVQHLCEAFSQSLGCVEVEHLTCTPLKVAQRLVEAYDNYGIDLIGHCEGCFTSDFAYIIHADPARVPYAGRWEGMVGFQQMLNIFFGMFTRKPGSLKPEYMVGNQRVHARFLDQAIFQGELTPPIIINLHFQFRGMQICQMDNEFDSDLTFSTLQDIASSH
jgi:transcriptional regulator with XRE-family HTH domain